MGKYRHFTDEESAGVSDEVMGRLDAARDLCGFPIVMTCGYRSPEHNANIGGAPDSAHCKGLAVDVAAPVGQFEREKLIWALGLSGFKRLELCSRHLHLDTDGSKPTPCCWWGEDK